jgi:hypothetical protein
MRSRGVVGGAWAGQNDLIRRYQLLVRVRVACPPQPPMSLPYHVPTHKIPASSMHVL